MPADAEIAILAPGVVTESPLPRRWRRRGVFTDLAGVDDSALLARAFGLEGTELPEAPLHYLGVTGNDPGGYCLLAWPVHLHARREQLILMTGPEFVPSEAESEQLAALIDGHFQEWRLERTADGMWFIVVADDPEIETSPLHSVLGEDINDHLPRGRDGMTWTGHLNEIQMLLFDAEVNEKREAQGAPTLNSLWVWGGGRLPDIAGPRWRRIVTNDPVARGIARRAGIDACDPREDTDTAGGTLWVHSRPRGVGGDQGLSSALREAFRGALKRREIDRLVLIEPGYGELVLDADRVTGWWPW